MADNSGPQCASHRDRQWKWNIDRKKLDWHRLVPFDDRPWLRWVFLIGLVLAVLAVLITGIVITAEYYATYYASGAWLLQKERANGTAAGTTGSRLSLPEVREEYDGLEGDRINTRLWLCGSSTCKDFDQAHICCPVGTSCFAMPNLSASGIMCCATAMECRNAVETGVAACVEGTTQCGEEMGGGCCPPGSSCADGGWCVVTSTPGKKEYKIGEVLGDGAAQGSQSAQGTQIPQSAPSPQSSQSSQSIQSPQNSQSPQSSQGSQSSQSPQNSQNPQSSQNPQGPQDPNNPQNPQSLGTKTCPEGMVFGVGALYAWVMAFYM